MGPQFAGQPDGGMSGLQVEGHGLRPCLRICRAPAVRVLDHEMDVQELVRRFPQALDNRETDRQVRDEMVVHDVNMDGIGSGYPLDFMSELGEIGVEDAGSDAHVRSLLAS